jgi:hypothetical protein
MDVKEDAMLEGDKKANDIKKEPKESAEKKPEVVNKDEKEDEKKPNEKKSEVKAGPNRENENPKPKKDEVEKEQVYDNSDHFFNCHSLIKILLVLVAFAVFFTFKDKNHLSEKKELEKQIKQLNGESRLNSLLISRLLEEKV